MGKGTRRRTKRKKGWRRKGLREEVKDMTELGEKEQEEGRRGRGRRKGGVGGGS